jgi:hypothetical protein
MATMPLHNTATADNVAPKRVIVGVDIGMTCTGTHPPATHCRAATARLTHIATRAGVAICSPDKTETGKPVKPVVIQRWPGSDVLENKVPTRLAYKAGNARPHSWGLACPSLEGVGPAMAVKELFKFYLDKPSLADSFKRNPEGAPGTHHDVMVWYTDFLAALYGHTVAHLKGPPWHVDWGSTQVEFIFSLPTSWKGNDRLVEDFEEIVKDAGFGSGENSSLVIGLTEGEAAAVSTATSLGHKYKVSLVHAASMAFPC